MCELQSGQSLNGEKQHALSRKMQMTGLVPRVHHNLSVYTSPGQSTSDRKISCREIVLRIVGVFTFCGYANCTDYQ